MNSLHSVGSALRLAHELASPSDPAQPAGQSMLSREAGPAPARRSKGGVHEKSGRLTNGHVRRLMAAGEVSGFLAGRHWPIEAGSLSWVTGLAEGIPLHSRLIQSLLRFANID